MKNLAKNIGYRLLFACLFVACGVSVHAQDIVHTYDMKVSRHPAYWYDGPIPVVIFGALFVLGVYLIYHFLSNGTLNNDMTDE